MDGEGPAPAFHRHSHRSVMPGVPYIELIADPIGLLALELLSAWTGRAQRPSSTGIHTAESCRVSRT